MSNAERDTVPSSEAKFPKVLHNHMITSSIPSTVRTDLLSLKWMGPEATVLWKVGDEAGEDDSVTEITIPVVHDGGRVRRSIRPDEDS